MNFELKLAWAYFRARRRSAARFTAIVAVVGIACGVASLIVVQALTRGYGAEMRDKILSNTAHVTIFQTNAREIQNWQIVKRELEKIENVRRVAPTAYESALIISEKTTGPAILRTMESSEFRVESEFSGETEIKDHRSQVADRIVEISLGTELAEKTGLKEGDEAKIVLPSDDFLPKTMTVRVAGTFQTGIYDYDATWIRLSPEDFARLLGKPAFAPTVLSVAVADVYAADETARQIRAALTADFKVVAWQEANRPLFAALEMEKKITLAIISIIIFIAALNIAATLAILVSERKLDVAVLRACGARARSLILIFLLEGLFLGLSGIFVGAAFGLAACLAGNHLRVIRLPAEIYSLSYVPLVPTAGDVLLVMAAALLLSLAATVFPAQKAAGIKPLENLRRQ